MLTSNLGVLRRYPHLLSARYTAEHLRRIAEEAVSPIRIEGTADTDLPWTQGDADMLGLPIRLCGSERTFRPNTGAADDAVIASYRQVFFDGDLYTIVMEKMIL